MDALLEYTASTQHPEAIDEFADASGTTMFPGKQKGPVPNFQMAMRISAEVKVVMGSTRMEFGDIAKLGPGAIIALSKRVSEPLDIVINGVVIARGHGCVTNADSEPCFGIILTELIDGIGMS